MDSATRIPFYLVERTTAADGAELENRPLYRGQDLFPAIREYLVAYGFRCAAEVMRDAWLSDYWFIARPAALPVAARWRERLARLRLNS